MAHPADPDQDLDWNMHPPAGLLDWSTASRVGGRLAGRGPTLTKIQRARVVDVLIYCVGPNVVEVEQRFRFPTRDFRMWLCLHEVTHRIQFGSVPWLKAFLERQIEDYLSQIEIDPKRVLEAVKKAAEEVR